ncbi:MAG: PilZ domain-containing protein [Planctomycetota bacterium]
MELLNAVILALTPAERWQAARHPSGNFVTESWFMTAGVVVIIALTVLLLVASYYNRRKQRRPDRRQVFIEEAVKRGLSNRESQILLRIATYARLRRAESVFTTSKAFERGAVIMMEKSLAEGQETEESRQLRTETSFLREKLGFRSQPVRSISEAGRSKKLSSREIPVGKKVHITRRTARTSDSIETTVIKNSDEELTLKLAMPVRINFGELWRARYYFGASVWEFDTSVVSYDGDVLILNHSDDVRFINRRRFLRVPVSKQALIASYPFSRTANTSVGVWGPPKFVPAVVTELAGLGLRIESQLKVKVTDRILVILKLDEQDDRNPVETSQNSKTTMSKIIEDIGEVRQVRAIANGFSIAVELTGLSDSDVSELIRATNAASVKAGSEGQNVPVAVNAKEGAVETVTAQGV